MLQEMRIKKSPGIAPELAGVLATHKLLVFGKFLDEEKYFAFLCPQNSTIQMGEEIAQVVYAIFNEDGRFINESIDLSFRTLTGGYMFSQEAEHYNFYPPNKRNDSPAGSLNHRPVKVLFLRIFE